MATLVNKLNREVKVIIPNMREFSTFYSDSEGVIGMFFKSNWKKETNKQEEHWKPSKEQMEALESAVKLYKDTHFETYHERIVSLYEQLKKLM